MTHGDSTPAPKVSHMPESNHQKFDAISGTLLRFTLAVKLKRFQ